MKKVYVLTYHISYEDTIIKGVFTTEEKARNYKDKLVREYKEKWKDQEQIEYYIQSFTIVEVTLDHEYYDIMTWEEDERR